MSQISGYEQLNLGEGILIYEMADASDNNGELKKSEWRRLNWFEMMRVITRSLAWQYMEDCEVKDLYVG
ncbi:MAG: hypothetical protein EZS28_002819 [Streblomastix strix]|uniref:Uncharacterized protein n=1 Tax=Streblomastix strix TaxID=222440 RepID=A0A5J4X322_9EUKA|nr:MAG: hypothetical protein EZS28_002819 [Streblomastix strix]